jgi:hypothetical protein
VCAKRHPTRIIHYKRYRSVRADYPIGFDPLPYRFGYFPEAPVNAFFACLFRGDFAYVRLVADYCICAASLHWRRVMAEGLTNKEIAQRLKLAEGTVKVHLHRIYRKLGIANRTALAVRANNQTL